MGHHHPERSYGAHDSGGPLKVGSGSIRDGGTHRLVLAFAILGTFTLIEGIGGYFANSIALLAEAAHMLADCGSLLLAVFAIRVGRRPANPRRTYGHRRYQPLAAFINGQLLLLLTVWVVYEAVLRLRHLPQVDGRLMLGVAVLGGIANLGAFLVLSGAHSLNERGARAHVLADLLGSAAASIAALLILYHHWVVADPLLSLVVCTLILRSAWSLVRESADVLLQSTPTSFDVVRVRSVLLGHVPGLVDVHHVHAWSMTGERPTVTLHAELVPGTVHRAALMAIHERLESELLVEHCTVQIEEGGCAVPDCGPDHAH